ncbi:MAG: hypothetical protein WCT07_03215 [Candidatus Paceibacterota bacterium]|jgi:cellobiose-specific phosphotransferase system component IIC
MLVILLLISGALVAMIAGSIIVIQYVRVSRGVLTIDSTYNGPAQVSKTLHAIIRYVLKRSVYARKFVMQYAFHILVRMMYYIDRWSTHLYALSRNWFVRNAVRNRGTVPHFWEHLKVYKQEMDKEREDE